MSEFLIIENLTYKNLFENLSFKVKQGQFVTISGGNNCGKTTLIRILGGHIFTEKTVNLFGRFKEEYPIAVWNEVITTIIKQEIPQYLFKTVEQELHYVIDLYKKEPEERSQSYKKIIKQFKLSKYQNSNPNDLSESNKIKLQLAKKIINNPQLLLLDDICHKLEEKEATEIMEILLNLKQQQKITIVMTTSNLAMTLKSDYLYVIAEKKILLEGKPLQVMEKDNILNRNGLDLPFMVDLSVKLRDYNLIDHIELDMDRMVETLWK